VDGSLTLSMDGSCFAWMAHFMGAWRVDCSIIMFIRL